MKPGGNIVPLPSAQMPPEVRYIHEHFPTPLSRTWHDAAHLDNVYVLTTTDIMIGPPGWEPEGGDKLLYRIVGSRRKLGDGVWLQFGVYAK